jgi:hypothetical protein
MKPALGVDAYTPAVCEIEPYDCGEPAGQFWSRGGLISGFYRVEA